MTKSQTLPRFCQSVLVAAVLGALSPISFGATGGAYFATGDSTVTKETVDLSDLTFGGVIHYEVADPDYEGKYTVNGVKSHYMGTPHNLSDMAIGLGSKVDQLTRRMDDLLLFGLVKYNYAGYLINDAGLQENVPEALAVGSYSYARSGSIEIGSHSLMAPDTNSQDGGLLFKDVQIGDTTIGDLRQDGVAQTTLGTNSYTNGSFAVTVGAYNVQSSQFNKDNERYETKNSELIGMGAAQNAFATINGSLNSNESATANGDNANYSGIANVISGAVNKVNNSNGTTVLGSGNVVTNSAQSMETFAKTLMSQQSDPRKDNVSNASRSSVTQKQQKLQEAMQTAGEVGAGLVVFGSANTINNAINTTVSGFHNKLDGTKNVILLGDNRQLTNVQSSIFLGSGTDVANPITTKDIKDAIAIGFNSNVTVNGGIALGNDSWSTEADNTPGWDLLTQAATKQEAPAWVSTRGAFAVGGKDNTRRISGVAAGSEDTDAVNVAQLKAVTLMVTANGGTDDSAENINGTGQQNLLVTKSNDSLSQGVHYDIKLNDQLGLGGDATKPNIAIDGTNAKVTVGADPSKQIVMDGAAGKLTVGNLTMDATSNMVTGLANTDWGEGHTVVSGRAATEGQLKVVDDKISGVDQRLKTTETTVKDLGTKMGELGSKVTEAHTRLEKITARVDKAENDLAQLQGMHWTAKASANGGVLAEGSAPVEVKNGNTVNFGVGNNLKLTQDGNSFTYELSDKLNIQSLEIQNADGSQSVTLAMNAQGQPSLTGEGNPRLTVNGNEVATMKDGMVYKDDAGQEVKVLMNQSLQIKGGAQGKTVANNIGVVGSDGALSVQLAKDIDLGAEGSVKAGGVKIDGKTGTISGLANQSWDPNNVDASRAATEGQLRDLAQNFKATDNTAKLKQLERDVNRMDTNIRDAGATAAALAGLKPLQYDPEKPTQAFGAVGAYRGREAIALGLGHYLNQDMLIHAGVGIGAHKMANAGFSMKFGFGQKKVSALNTYQTEPMKAVYQLEGEMKALQSQNQLLNERNQALDARNNEIDRANAKLMANNEEMEKKLQRMAQQLDALEKKMGHKKP